MSGMPGYVGVVDEDGGYVVRSVWYDANPAALLPSLHLVWRGLRCDWKAVFAQMHQRDWSHLVPYDETEQRGAGSEWVHVPYVGRGYPDNEISPVPRRGSLRERTFDESWLYLVRPSHGLVQVYGTSQDSRWQIASAFNPLQWASLIDADALAVEVEFPGMESWR